MTRIFHLVYSDSMSALRRIIYTSKKRITKFATSEKLYEDIMTALVPVLVFACSFIVIFTVIE